jgi:DNA-binding response OmpR family regulator
MLADQIGDAVMGGTKGRPLQQHASNLRVLICEDEYLLATELASELSRHNITVAGIMSRVADVEAAIADASFNANAAVLDVKLIDGDTFSLVEPMRAKGMAIVFCTAYRQRDLPPEYAEMPVVGKPTDVGELLAAFTDASGKEAR